MYKFKYNQVADNQIAYLEAKYHMKEINLKHA